MMTQGAPENQAEIQSEAATGQEALLRELELRGAAIIQLRQGLEAKEGEIAALARENGGLRQAVEGLKASLAEAVAAYRALVLKATPELPAELVSGSSIAEIDEAVGRGRAIVERIRQGMEDELARQKVPAGNSQRLSPDFSELSAREKIQHAVRRFLP